MDVNRGGKIMGALGLLGMLILFVLGASPSDASKPPSFLSAQLQYPRVRDALKNKKDIVKTKLSEAGLSPDNLNIVIVVYKDTGTLEIHAKPKAATEKKYKLLESYPICTFSGELGPKRQEGDEQAPEGFYFVESLNPASSYHLALKVSYPNRADRQHTPKGKRPGGMIMIHGDCVSIGCLAMTDELIEEIYLMTVYAMNNGQKQIPVYMFPFRMTAENMTYYLNGGAWPKSKERTLWTNIKQQCRDWLSGDANKYAEQKEFWENLKKGYDRWTETGEELQIGIDKEGKYTVGE